MPDVIETSELRSLLHAKVDEFAGDALAILHRVALRLELQQLVSTVGKDFDALREAGRLDGVEELNRGVRAK